MKKSDFALNVNPYLWEIGYFRYKRIFGARPIKPHFEPILYFKKLPLTRNLAKSKPAQKNRFRTGPKSEEVGGGSNKAVPWYKAVFLAERCFKMVHNEFDPSYALSTNFREYGGMCMGF